MPNLIPQSVLDRFYFGWAHPAGRLIFALLALAIGMSFVLALIRPPLEHKILRPKQGVPLIVVLVIGCYLVGGFFPAIQILMVWTIIFGVTALALAYAVIPSEWITFSDKYLRWTPDKVLVGTYLIKPNYQQLRDLVVVVIYSVFFGANLLLWVKWQQRLVPKPEPAVEAGKVLRTSRFGRPVKSKV